MEDALKKLTTELRAEIEERLAEPEAKEVIEATEKAADTDAGTFEVVITTENLDRYEEVIKLEGWELEHYRNNPVVLWGHDHKQLPIGIASDIRVENGKMIAQGKFALHPFAQTVRQLYDAGVMRATSVGFIEKEREGNLITKAELIEFSFVSVPANPYALSTMVKSGVSINEMVTKGFVTVKEEAEQAPEAPEEPETHETPVEPSQPAEPRVFDTEAVEAAKQALQGALIALEALGQKAEEPEGNEAPEADAEVQALKEFSEKRRVIQQASTILGEVLAEARQAIEAQRAA